MASKNANFSLAEVHKEVMPIIIPIISVITILMFIGVIGNAAVIYIYGFVLKKTTVHYFITMLAVFDFICCLLGFPLESAEFYYKIDYPSSGLCKWQRLITFGCSIGSIIVLLLISIERYRKVCRPANYQLNMRHAKYFIYGVWFLSVLLASPMILFSNKREVLLKQFENKTGYGCILSNEDGKGPLIYFLTLLMLITVTLSAMLILYGLLWRTARKHFLQSDARYQQSVNNAEAGTSPARRQHSRTNQTVISITILFVISFYPTILLSIFADKLLDYMNYKEQLIFFLFVRMYILGSSFNPLVYGFCNKYFRHTFVNLLQKIFCVSSTKIQSPSTETS